MGSPIADRAEQVRERRWPFPRHEPGRPAAIALLRRLLLLVTAWHLADSAIGVGTGAVIASPAVVAFGVCSFSLLLGSLVVLWRFSPEVADRPRIEEMAGRLVGVSFYLVAILAVAGAIWALAVEHDPPAKLLDIAVAAATLVVMVPVGLTTMRLGEAVGSAAARAEGYQTLLYGLLAAALLLGLVGNAWADAWWADPIATLVIAAAAARAGWRLRHDEPVPQVSPT